MVKPDVITTNPYGIDSPYFRWLMKEYKPLFGKVINGYYNDQREDDYSGFWRIAMPDAVHVDIGLVKGRDWRDDTVNACLEKSDSEWVLFIEQDVVILEEGWLEGLLEKAEDYDVVGYGDMYPWSEDVRLHPAFILVRREFIEKTQKDFGAYPEKNRDHFSIFTEDLFKIEGIRYLDIGPDEDKNFEHLKGTYSNYMLVQAGNQPNYDPDRFRKFVEMTLPLDIPWDPRFREWSKKCLLKK